MIMIEAAYFYDSEDTSSTDSGDFDSGSTPASSGDGMEGSSDKKNRMKSVQIREIKITGQFQNTFTLRYVLFFSVTDNYIESEFQWQVRSRTESNMKLSFPCKPRTAIFLISESERRVVSPNKILTCKVSL